MAKESDKGRLLTVSLILALPMVFCLCSLATVSVNAQQETPGKEGGAKPPAADPIVAIGHGSIVGKDGKNIELTAPYIELVQEFYINELLTIEKRKDKEKQLPEENVAATRKAIRSATDDKILGNALLIDWLIEKVQPSNRAHIVVANNALRWHYVHKIQKDPVLPEKNEWGKGLKRDAAKRLGEQIGTTVLALTNSAGEAYCRECEQAGVPVPDFMFGNEWRFVGEITNEFISESARSELWIHESSTPPGICLALPRFGPSGKAELFGVICLGKETGKVCFFDNPNGRFYDRDVPIDFKSSFVGGTDLVLNGQGVCSDCHAGENPYVVHPDKPPFASLGSLLQSPVWHDPLVDASWPQNPGPTNQLDAVSSPSRCDACHRVGGAGRFPEVSTQLSQYCQVVLATAIGSSAKRTMPQGLGSTAPYTAHINSLTNSCSGPPSGGGVVVEVSLPNDPNVLTGPIVIDPLYGCATSVSVRGAVLDAKVTLFVNGNPAGAPIFPARNTIKLEFTGLPALAAGDLVKATQEKDGVASTSPTVTVRDHRVDFPSGLPAPTIDPTLVYECADVISVRHVPGATVTVFSNGGTPVTGTGSTDWTVFAPGKRPFVVGDSFTAQQSLCGDPPSPISTPPVSAVAAPSSLPPVKFTRRTHIPVRN
jgi:hypothetical protein